MALASHAVVADVRVTPDAVTFAEGEFWDGTITASSDQRGTLCLTNWPALVDAQGNDTLRILPEAFRTAPACVSDTYVETHTFYRGQTPYTKTWEWTQNADTGRWEFPIDITLTTEDDNILGGNSTREVAVNFTEGVVTFHRSFELVKEDDERVNVRARFGRRNGKVRLYVSRPIADYTRTPAEDACNSRDVNEPMTGALCTRMLIEGDGWLNPSSRLFALLLTQKEIEDSHADGYWLNPYTIPDYLYDCSLGQVTATLAAFAHDRSITGRAVRVRSNPMKFCKEG